MKLDINSLLNNYQGENYTLHEKHINPQFGHLLNSLGFNHCYTSAKGSYLWDKKGNEYLDMMSGYGVFALGRNNPHINRTLTDFINNEMPSLVQLEASLPAGILAKKLKERIPYELDYVYFTNSGTEGIETAIKYARCATSRPTILSAEGAYHGSTTGSLSLYSNEFIGDHFGPLLTDVKRVPFNDLVALEKALANNDIAAFIVEPIQGMLVNIPSPGYLREASRLCRQHGTLFCADEILTGIGRTGRFLALEHDDSVDPDIVVLSKTLSAGQIPVGAVLTKKQVYEKVFSSVDCATIHSSTFGQGSLAMIAGLATLDYIEKFNVLDNVSCMSNLLGIELSKLKDQYKIIHEIRQKGLLISIKFNFTDKFSGATSSDIASLLMKNHRILTRPGSIESIVIVPTFIIEKKEINYFITAFEEVIKGYVHPG